MVRFFNRIWNTLRQCVGNQTTSQDAEEDYQPLDRSHPQPSHNRSASPNSVSDSISITVRSSGSECSGDTWREQEELRKGYHHPYIRNESIENPSLASDDSGYESAPVI